jgi:hypothetical protein
LSPKRAGYLRMDSIGNLTGYGRRVQYSFARAVQDNHGSRRRIQCVVCAAFRFVDDALSAEYRVPCRLGPFKVRL